MPSATPVRRSRRRRGFVAAAFAAFAALLAPLGIAQASAAPDVQAGVYEGYIGNSTERMVSFPVSSSGVIGEISGQTYMYCSGWPVPIYWGENPPIQIADDGSFYAEYWFTYDDPTSDTRFRFSGQIDSNGIATGEMRVHMPNLDGCAEGTEPFTAYNVAPVADPDISVSPTTVTVSELAAGGIEVLGTDFPADSTVTFDIGGVSAGSATTNASGSFTGTASATVSAGTHTLTATSGAASASATITVEADPVVYNPEISLVPTTVTVSELADAGTQVTGEGFPANTAVELRIGSAAAGNATTDAEGRFSASATATVAPGTHTVTATAGGETATAQLTVEADPIVYDPEISLSPDTVTVSELADGGIDVLGTDFPAGASVSVTIGGTTAGDGTVAADGTFTIAATASVAPGTHTLTASANGVTATAQLTVEADPVVYDPEITLAPTTVTVSDLADSGVAVEGTGFPADSTVTFTIGGTDAGTATADADGSFSGTASAAVAAGTHTLTASANGVSATAQLTVEADPVVYDPEISLSPDSVTVSELAGGGIDVLGDDFPAGASVSVTIDGTPAGNGTVASDGTFSVAATASVAPGTHTVTATAGGETASAELTVEADPVVVPDASIELEPTTTTVDTLARDGIAVTGADFAPETEITVSVGSVSTAVQSDADGGFTAHLTATLAPGSHSVTATDGETSAEATLTVTADVYEPALDVTPTELSQEELAETGVLVTASGFRPGTELTVTFDGAPWQTLTTDEFGDADQRLTRTDVAPGEHVIAVEQLDTVTTTMRSGLAQINALAVSVTITVTETVVPTVEVDVDEVTVSDLADGIAFSGSGFTAGETLSVLFDGDPVTTVTADDDGTFSGTLALEGVEPGEYQLQVAGDGATASVTVTVLADAAEPEPSDPTEPTPSDPVDPTPSDPEPSESDDVTAPEPTASDADAGDRLPRTGSDAGFLAAIALAMLLIGGGALVTRMRRA